MSAHRSAIVSAVAVPVLVAGQFAMLAVVPVAVVLVATFRSAHPRALHGWAALLGVAYAVPLALWAIGPERAPSLSKNMDPVSAAGIVATAAAYVVAYVVTRRRAARTRIGEAV